MNKKKILYIEDNEQNFYLVQYLLSSRGHTVFWASEGREGLAEALTVDPDLILLDIQLPVMDGYAVARALREHEQLADTPLIAITSYAMTGDREKAIGSGCTGYITKPINPDTFITEVEGFLHPDT